MSLQDQAPQISDTEEGFHLSPASLIAGGAIAAIFAGCSSDGGGDDTEDDGGSSSGNTTISPDGPDITFTAITVAASSDSGDASVDGGSASKTFTLGSGTVPADPGSDSTEEAAFAFDVVDASDTRDITVRINPTRLRTFAAIDGFSDIRHTLVRIGVGVQAADIARFANSTHDEMVDTLVDEMSGEPMQDAPGFTKEKVLSWDERRNLDDDARSKYDSRRRAWPNELKQWWHQELYLTPSPLTERMVLFWHGVWTSSLEAVPAAHLMWNQNQLMRHHGTRNFATMARLLAKDPAMVRYLDSDSNVKESPNENFARELMELFSLGEGQDYTEADIAAIARAFTGYALNDHFEFEFDGSRHDYDDKTYFGTTHSFSSLDESLDGFSYLEGDYVINQILEKDRCSEFLCERLWDEFIALPRDTLTIQAWATVLRDNDYAIKPLLRTILKSQAFKDARGTRIKTPIEYIIGTHRTLELPPEDFDDWRWLIGSMGQDLMEPPNVRGWPSGTGWIDAEKYLQRRNRAGWLTWKLRNDLGPEHETALDQLLLVVSPLGVIRSDEAENTLYDILHDLGYQLA